MSNYKDLEYWKRRIRANTAPIPTGDMKMLLATLIERVEETDRELESLRSARATKPAKKLGPGSDSTKDA